MSAAQQAQQDNRHDDGRYAEKNLTAQQDNRHDDGRYAEKNLTDPGVDTLESEPSVAAAFLCGRCGCPVYEKRGSFVDESGSNECGDDVHTGHRYDTPEIDELAPGDTVLIGDGPVMIVDVEQVTAGGDPEGRLIRYRHGDDPDELCCDIETAGAQLYRLTSPALTPYPMYSALDDYGVGGLVCGRCGEPVIDWRGTWVDENKSTRCGSGRHAGHHTGVTSQVAGCDELHTGDTLILDGERVTVVSLDSDYRSTSVEFRFDNPFDGAVHVRSFDNDELFDRVTSGTLPPATGITEGPDPHRFSTTAMVRAERALDGASVAGDGDDLREAAAVVNLMRARRLADYTRHLHPTSEQVILEPAAAGSSNDLQVAGIRLADGTTITRGQLSDAGHGALAVLDGEACRLGEDGNDDWIRTCSTSSRGRRHVMELFEASRIDRIDLDRGTYDPARYDRG